MGEGRRPNLATSPGERGRGSNKGGLISVPMGNLKCNWDYMILSFEDQQKNIKKNMWIFYLIPVIGFGIPLPFGIVIGIISENWLIGVFLGVFFSAFTGILFTLYIRTTLKNSRDPKGERTNKAGWNNIGHKNAMRSVREFAEQYGKKFSFCEDTKNKQIGWKHPEEIYTFDNGVKIKAQYSRINNQPAGWCAINYIQNNWENALELQLALDEYMSDRKILGRRRGH